ncbi:hypothetical protein PIB30_090358 [Stylosanthes scabra]|uniref:Uncharacterized protein n=1 Tax=Stylosanthes scabra TaxID=79078 RepID=A0ABU6UTK0_9FABA|nr:hypothetical protein [Stylosanthes scabra]
MSSPSSDSSRIFWGCVYYDVHQEYSFFRWADIDSEPFVAELGKLGRKVELLKLKASVANRRLNLAIVIGIVGWMLCFIIWFIINGSCLCSGRFLSN